MTRLAAALVAALAFVSACGAADVPRVELVGEISWREPAKHHGGFSGLEVDAAGKSFVAVSDRGWLAEGMLLRKGGRLTGAEGRTLRRLRTRTGARMPRDLQDSEGLAQAGDGALYISFEGMHRVLRYDNPGAAATALPVAREFAGFGTNSGMEALAIDADGALYTLPERSARRGAAIPLYRFQDERWSVAGAIPRHDDFVPVGADFGPDGLFYLLERTFTLPFGFASRIRRFRVGPDGVADEQILLTTRTGTHDNLEGLSVWRDRGGAIRLTMISDDNFLPVQRTEIVEYRLSE